jgi:2-polyprenyl-6-methoxyphenol hydroxylase-like FAD-dependent oxidoreductase
MSAQAGEIATTCCIAGGGPAGMMAGFLLARAGVEVAVLEKHADFLRDFRGDTIHPSTLEIMHELGLLDAFLELPHQRVEQLGARIGKDHLEIADFRHLPTRCKFLAFMPQGDVLDFLADHGRRYPGFHLHMQAEATDLLIEDGVVRGLLAHSAQGPMRFTADLVVGADGRHSTLRDRAGFKVLDIGAPMDVLWFRVSRRASDENETFGRVEAGRLIIMLNRGDYWQCAYVIPKNRDADLRAAGLEAFRADVARLSPALADRVGEIDGWDKVKLLTVAVDRLETWHRPGLLCIGDAAHAMSPIGGVGINLAVQDAVAAANILAAPLAAGVCGEATLGAVQRRRAFPTRATQAAQVFIQKRLIAPILNSTAQAQAPWPLRLLAGIPLLRRIPARLVGIGVRPEHVHTPAASAGRA